MKAWVDQMDQLWSQQLAAFKAHVEADTADTTDGSDAE